MKTHSSYTLLYSFHVARSNSLEGCMVLLVKNFIPKTQKTIVSMEAIVNAYNSEQHPALADAGDGREVRNVVTVYCFQYG